MRIRILPICDFLIAGKLGKVEFDLAFSDDDLADDLDLLKRHRFCDEETNGVGQEEQEFTFHAVQQGANTGLPR